MSKTFLIRAVSPWQLWFVVAYIINSMTNPNKLLSKILKKEPLIEKNIDCKSALIVRISTPTPL